MNNSTHLSEELFKSVKRLHFIGIGGSGMFPIVQIFHSMGYEITGSDNNPGAIIDMLYSMKIPVSLVQNAENVKNSDLIIYTAAILPDNPELLAAKASGIPLVERAQVLGWLTKQFSDCCCVCGTHGKTTVTSMLTQILYGAGKDPSCVIGGKLAAIGGYGRKGNSSLMTCEACEFQDHFLLLHPSVSVFLNIDNDHMEYFKTMERVRQSYRIFGEKTAQLLILNGDDENIRLALDGLEKQRITFGWDASNDYYPTNWHQMQGVTSTFTLMHHGENLGQFTINVPGRHNVLNAVAALAAAFHYRVSVTDAQTHLKAFHGAGRRFEVLGKIKGGSVTVVDDYAHHPAELAATLSAAKTLPFRHVWAVFQPFTYSRTKLLMDDFAKALSIADHVILSEIMGSREKNTEGVYASQLAEKIPGCQRFSTFEEIVPAVLEGVREGDLVITMGCGDVYKCAHMILNADKSSS